MYLTIVGTFVYLNSLLMWNPGFQTESENQKGQRRNMEQTNCWHTFEY